jgi:CBS-domain-containing membrane protein
MGILMNIIDKKLKKNLGRYIFQCGLATGTILLILIFLDILTHTAIIATLGATAFVVFTMPRAYASGPRPLFGGYLIGICVGWLCSFVSTLILKVPIIVTQITAYIIFGALAVGIAIFLMTITNTEHAPAAGMALGLVINQWDFLTIFFILAALMFMAALRKFIRPVMIDLRDLNERK